MIKAEGPMPAKKDASIIPGVGIGEAITIVGFLLKIPKRDIIS